MRFTDKIGTSDSDIVAYDTRSANIVELPDLVEGKRYTGGAIYKLGPLEDIEEELGINLETLFKALKNGIYVKNRKNEIRRVSCNIGLVETGGHNSLGLRFQDTNYKWRYLVLDTSRDNDVNDYGKTWALTKEELL